MYDCHATLLLNIYSYRVFVGEGWLPLVPSYLPHLRWMCLSLCGKVPYKNIEELMAAAPELEVTS
jgi:hypothetical protein